MGILNLKPSRRKYAPDTPVMMDLDALIAKPQTFRWQGQVYAVKPITTETFFRVVNQIAVVQKFGNATTSKDPDAFYRAYADLFETCIDGIGYEEVRRMQVSQIAALLQYVIDVVQGRTEEARAGTVGEKKNTPPS